MGRVGGYRDVFDVAVAVQTAQLPIRMAAAGAFKAGVPLDVCTVYTRERMVYVPRGRINLLRERRLRKIYRKPYRRGNAVEPGRDRRREERKGNSSGFPSRFSRAGSEK